jgi:hypothetical protein
MPGQLAYHHATFWSITQGERYITDKLYVTRPIRPCRQTPCLIACIWVVIVRAKNSIMGVIIDSLTESFVGDQSVWNRALAPVFEQIISQIF